MGTVSPDDRDSKPGEPVRSRFFGRSAALKSPNDALQPEVAPAPPAKKVRVRKRSMLSMISGFFTFLVVLTIAGIAGIIFLNQKLRAPGPLKLDTVVVIPPRTDKPDILNRLENEGVIDSQMMMFLALLMEGTPTLKAGEYNFKQAASLQEVIDTLVGGHSVLHSFTIPEGLTSEQIVVRLREQDLLENDIKNAPKEGTLMPNTYKFARGEARDKLIQRMMDAQKKELAEIWARRASDLPLKSPYELVTLASIVERETGKADERTRVAGVFINRINRNMPLQSDPTIVYGLVGGKGSLGHAITREELNRVSPYNTYQIRGLPPGPIGNPGRAALEAVANPSRTQELFFVADGTGGHVFAETLDQHNKNVVRWRQIEKDAKDRLAPDAEKLIAPTKSPDQKGDIELPTILQPILPSAFAANDPPQGVALEAIARLAAAMAQPTPTGNARVAESRVPLRQTAPRFGSTAQIDFSNFSQLNLGGIVGDNSVPDSQAEFPVDLNVYPVSSSRRADQKSRAARFGLSDGGDLLPTQPVSIPPAPSANPQQIARARAFDASEGTSIDPLKNKTYDLNSPKTVPNIR